VLLSAAVLKNGVAIGLKFDELLDPASAGNAENYVLFGGSSTVTNAALQPDGMTVLLQLDQPVTNRVVIFADGVKDLAGNASSTLQIVHTVNLTAADIGTTNAAGVFTDPKTRGVSFATSSTDFEVTAGGSDIWNNTDGFHFIYKQVTGDFDVRVRVENVEHANQWSKAGVMVRESLAAGSRDINMVVDPTLGANVWEENYRQTANGASAGLPGNVQVPNPPYPNAWVRLTRKGDTFGTYRSSDGVNWIQVTTNTITPSYPAATYVGVCTTAHDDGNLGLTTHAKYHNFSLTGPNVGPLLNIVRNGDHLLISWPASEDGFTLESGSTEQGWTPVQAPVETQGDENIVVLPVSDSLKLYRLSR
jgi:regulation of enolase protein 1 (concanavalin A-like superfamily)